MTITRNGTRFLTSIIVVAFSLHALGSTLTTITYPDNTPPKKVDIWCGKAYRATDAPFPDLVDAGWLHPPPRSAKSLLDFTCRPVMKPYVEDIKHSIDALQPRIILDGKVSHNVGVPFPRPVNKKPPNKIWVKVSVIYLDPRKPTAPAKTITLNESTLYMGRGAQDVQVNLNALPPRPEPYIVSCTAALDKGGKVFATASSELYWLPPNPYGGSTVYLDSSKDELVVFDKTSALPGTFAPKGYHSFFPIGYYTGWGGYLASNFSILKDIKSAGFTMVHPIPGGGPANSSWGDDPNSIQHFLALMDACLEVGLWVMYDMRHTYSSPEELAIQIKTFRSHPALLLWYTADEPDGHNDPTNSTLLAYRTIQEMDGYHPISFTPNCQNYFFTQYASGADIVVPDIYPVGNNPKFSKVYNTVCNRTYGCCGCDNCPGTLQDLGNRINEMREYTRWTGTHKVFWGVGQAFGSAEFWERTPTGEEVVEMSDSAVKAGTKGLLYWSAPTTDDIWKHTAKLARRLNPNDSWRRWKRHGELRTDADQKEENMRTEL
ncbi:hypothetical protein K440DRAFT_606648 [Wilcoxina mikolae CBS 423.85]|nr:hypothetical protein K440DRAFT_606648 [Wilcoxina mikolae CBS 423.85]